MRERRPEMLKQRVSLRTLHHQDTQKHRSLDYNTKTYNKNYVRSVVDTMSVVERAMSDVIDAVNNYTDSEISVFEKKYKEANDVAESYWCHEDDCVDAHDLMKERETLRLSVADIVDSARLLGRGGLCESIYNRFVSVFKFYNIDAYNRIVAGTDVKTMYKETFRFIDEMSENDLRVVFSPFAYDRFTWVRDNLTNGCSRGIKHSTYVKVIERLVDNIAHDDRWCMELCGFIRERFCGNVGAIDGRVLANYVRDVASEWFVADQVQKLMVLAQLGPEVIDAI
jgi:hypothetical protein